MPVSVHIKGVKCVYHKAPLQRAHTNTTTPLTWGAWLQYQRRVRHACHTLSDTVLDQHAPTSPDCCCIAPIPETQSSPPVITPSHHPASEKLSLNQVARSARCAGWWVAVSESSLSACMHAAKPKQHCTTHSRRSWVTTTNRWQGGTGWRAGDATKTNVVHTLPCNNHHEQSQSINNTMAPSRCHLQVKHPPCL